MFPLWKTPPRKPFTQWKPRPMLSRTHDNHSVLSGEIGFESDILPGLIFLYPSGEGDTLPTLSASSTDNGTEPTASTYVLLPPQPDINVTPVVTNVTAHQVEGTKDLEIFYDLAVADGHSCTITVKWSTDNGATFPLTATAVTGAAGPGMTPGVGKSIIWDMGVDWDNQFTQTGRIKITASCEELEPDDTGDTSGTGNEG